MARTSAAAAAAAALHSLIVASAGRFAWCRAGHRATRSGLAGETDESRGAASTCPARGDKSSAFRADRETRALRRAAAAARLYAAGATAMEARPIR